jgi:hypothetical protein
MHVLQNADFSRYQKMHYYGNRCTSQLQHGSQHCQTGLSLLEIFPEWQNQMLGCGAHVLIIAPQHVRCASGSACGKSLEMCVWCACVRLIFERAMCNCTFGHFFEQNDNVFCFRMSFSCFANILQPNDMSGQNLCLAVRKPNGFNFIQPYKKN